MNGLNDFLNMGGYAFYVWGSYGITLLVLAVNLVVPMINERKLLNDLARRARADRHSGGNL
ncbi:MAG: hypothetical protein BMS9Abin15_0774 [Gammaproteobacteria bacterium]|nr:MAG: hypothetical protein BMS9Abin15_0774 [Gammaproteobacteria bacterium]